MPSEKRKAKKQNYYNKVKKSRKYSSGLVLQEGLQGFLITCNNREKEATREAYSILNEIADKLVGPETGSDISPKENDSDEEDIDIDDAFDKEKSSLDNVKSKPVSERRFQSIESGANNCLFIKTIMGDPSKLVEEIIKNILTEEVRSYRYILRIIPIIGTCKAYEKNIEELLNSILSRILVKDREITYCLIFKTRNNNQVRREDMIKLVGSCVNSHEARSSVDLKNPELGIVIEVLRNICCIGITWNYYGKRKYNLSELVQVASSKEESAEGVVSQIYCDSSKNSSNGEQNTKKETNNEEESTEGNKSQNVEKGEVKSEEEPTEGGESQIDSSKSVSNIGQNLSKDVNGEMLESQSSD